MPSSVDDEVTRGRGVVLMSEHTFVVGQQVIAEDTEREGIVREIDPGVNAYWYAVDFGDLTLNYPHSLLRPAPVDPPLVAEWQDISGSGHTLTQADADHQPILVSAPTTPSDDERVKAIREWTNSIWAEDEFELVAENTRFLLTLLSAQQARIEELTRALEPLNALWRRYIHDDKLSDYVGGGTFHQWLESDENFEAFYDAYWKACAAFRHTLYGGKKSDGG